ncbi:uncharacterized protein LOC144120914 [Amblyomma americanum]
MVSMKPSMSGLLLLFAVIASQCICIRAQLDEYTAGTVMSIMNATTSPASTQSTSTTIKLKTTMTSTTTTTSTTTAEPDRLQVAFRELSEKMTRIVTREFYPVVSDLIYDPNLSSSCIGSLMKIGTALRTLDIWAVQSAPNNTRHLVAHVTFSAQLGLLFAAPAHHSERGMQGYVTLIDAMGRPPAGMMQGRLSGYGAYDQCLAVRHDEGLFQGKYCMVHLGYNGSQMTPSLRRVVRKFAKHLGFESAGNLTRMVNNKGFTGIAQLYKFGVCVPSHCEPEDLQVIMDHLTKDFNLQLKAKWCAIDEPVKLNQRQTLILCIFGVWVSFILFGTAYDFYKAMLWGDEYTDSAKTFAGYMSRAVRAFSLRRATKKLVQMPNWGDYSNELGFVHGIRVLSATWVVLGHSYMIRDPYNNSNFVAFFTRLRDDFLFTVQSNSFMAVETFLVIT